MRRSWRVRCGLRAGEEYAGRFVEELLAPQRLFVLGAGDDARPLVKMAALLGWSVTVADGRGQLAKAERFPAAERVVLLDGGAGQVAGVERLLPRLGPSDRVDDHVAPPS